MEEPNMDKLDDPQATKESSSKSRNSNQETANQKPSVNGDATPTVNQKPSVDGDATPIVRRSGRATKTPGHFKDFVMN